MSNEYLPISYTWKDLTIPDNYAFDNATPQPYYSHAINLRVTEAMIDAAIIAGGFEYRLTNTDVRESMKNAIEAALELLAKG